MSLRIKIFTVPGQVLHASTRRLVLQGADGVAFIADSQISETEHNAASFLDLRQNLDGARPQPQAAAARHPVQQARPRPRALRRGDRRPRAPRARAGLQGERGQRAGRARDVLRPAAPHLDEARRRAPAREDARHRAARAPADGGAAARLSRPTSPTLLAACVGGNLDRHTRRCPHERRRARTSRVEDILLDGRIRLEDLVDRDGLDELCRSFHALFGIPVRIYSNEGALLADAAGEQELCAYVNTLAEGRKACASIVGAVQGARRRARPGDVAAPVLHRRGATASWPSSTTGGASGRLIVGPVPARQPGRAAADRCSRSIPGSTAERAKALLAKMPRAKAETVTRIAAHLKSALDLILFSRPQGARHEHDAPRERAARATASSRRRRRGCRRRSTG